MRLLENIVRVTEEDAIEDWPSIMKIVDIDTDDARGKEAVDIIHQRLKHPSEIVCLNTFTLLVALVQNCETAIKSPIIDSFTPKSILRLYKEKLRSSRSKEKIHDLLSGLISETGDKSLKLFFQSTLDELLEADNLSPSSLNVQREKVRQAIALSFTASQANSDELRQLITNLGTSHNVEALYDLNSSKFGEISFEKGDEISVISTQHSEWWLGELKGKFGYFPANYVRNLPRRKLSQLSGKLKVVASSEDLNEMWEELKSKQATISALDISLELALISKESISQNELDKLQNNFRKLSSSRRNVLALIDHHKGRLDELLSLNEKLLKARSALDQLTDTVHNNNNNSNNY